MSDRQKPNILMIVADDLNSWIGPLGRHPDVRTPAIDALARRGTLFTRAYCPAPFCNASRMSVFTGCLPSTTGIYENEPYWDTPSQRPNYIEHLRRQGYHTSGAGKVFHGKFDYRNAGRKKSDRANWIDQQNRLHIWDAFAANRTEPLPAQRPLNRMFDFARFEEVPSKYHLFDWGPIPDDAEDAMPDEAVVRTATAHFAAPPQQPFFFAAGLYKPHLPWHVPKRFFDLYDPETLALPPVKRNDLDDVPKIAQEWALTPDDHALVQEKGQWRHAVQGYLAAISYCDWMIGRIVAALDASGLAGDTTIVLCGDNGFHLGEKLHWRKFVLWEEATRVPLIVVPPRGRSMRPRIHDPVSVMDLFPTLCDLSGLAQMAGVDAASLMPLMNSETPHRRPAVMTWGRGNHSVRAEHWRLTRYRDGSEELYDLASDPNEWTNLAGDAAFDAVRDGLRRHLPDDAN
jgi:arylsulfatase A-like enzyme